MVQRRWKLGGVPDGTGVRDLAQALRCSMLLARLLCRRGISAPDVARDFLKPKLSSLHDPASLPQIDAAVSRVEHAIRQRESVAIFGDYDVDGVSSTALLYEFFRLIQFPVTHHLPSRLGDGYGLKPHSIDRLADDGVRLVVTVDNGVSAHEAIERARGRGVDVVVLDHHQPPMDLPQACAIVNPWLPDSRYPYQNLAGVGVTFKFVWALCQRLSRQTKLSDEFRTFLMDALGLVALGTVADVVPLTGENRVLVRFGLRALQASQRPGLRQLVSNVRRGEGVGISATDVAFRIAPVINAAGRLGRAETALELILTKDADEAQRISKELQAENRRRRQIEVDIFSEACDMVRESVNLQEERAIVLGAPGWHVGVIGVVASRLMEEFFRPTLLVAFDGDRGRGSARSIPGVHIARALAACSECLVSHGGHELAAGVEIDPSRLDDLRSRLNGAIGIAPQDMVPVIEADAVVSLAELSRESLEEIELLEPFGAENPSPLFLVEDAEVVGKPKIIGSDSKHLSFHVRHDGVVRRAIAFGQGAAYDSLCAPSTTVSLLAQPQLSTWGAPPPTVELNVREIRVSRPARV